MESELRDGYKMTELGALPEEWEAIKCENLFKLTSGLAKTQKEIATESTKGTIPVYGGNGITSFTLNPLITHETIVIGRVGEYCGTVHLSLTPCWITDNALYIKNVENNVNINYLFSSLNYFDISKLKNQTGQPLISQQPIYNLTIPLPPLPEQRRIATILSTLDETVEHTEALIEKYKNIKVGLMSDLLTCGIDEEGRIRNEGTHRFKDSALGRVPDELEVVSLGNYAKMMVPMRDKPKDLSGPIPWTRIEDFHGKYLYGSINNRGVNEETVGQMNLKVYPINTVLCSCSCSMGVCAITKNELISNQTFIGIVASNKLFYEFLYYLMTSYSEKLKKMSTGTTIDYLPRQKFEDLQIPLPPLPEQRRIAEILTAADQRIEKEEAYRDKLLQLKKGLMQDLLTGKVRVKAMEAEA